VSRNSLSFSRGTPYYMAPEMLQRRGDARSDIYSLGVILYECLYGDVPFRGDSEWEVLRKHEVAPLEFPADSLPRDREVVQRCMAKDPAQRFAAATDLLRALQAPAALGESLRFDTAPPRPQPASEPGAAATAKAGFAADPDPAPAPAAAERDAGDSPYGLPWAADRRGTGAVAWVVRAIFALLEAVIFVLLLPVRAVSAIAGRGFVWLVKLPFRILAAAAQLLGLLLVAALLLLVVVVVLSLVSAA
jgi:hypothetical protein